MDIRNILNHSPFICKPTQEIHDKQVTEYDFDSQSFLVGDFYGYSKYLKSFSIHL